MKHLLGAAFIIAVIILIIIGLTAEDPPLTELESPPAGSQMEDVSS